MLKEIYLLSALQFKMEIKNKNSLYAVLLYVVSSIFIVYMAIKNIEDPKVWNALFWIIQLFTCLNAATRSFQYSKGRDLYYFQLASPRPYILSKILYNVVLMLLVFVLSLLTFTVMLGNPFPDMTGFVIVGILGVTSLSSLLTMMAAIAFKADNNYTLLAILSLPIMIPLLIILVHTTAFVLDGLAITDYWQNLSMLMGLNVMNIVLSYILFPYLCTD
jgi:heme exporter protein B